MRLPSGSGTVAARGQRDLHSIGAPREAEDSAGRLRGIGEQGLEP